MVPAADPLADFAEPKNAAAHRHTEQPLIQRQWQRSEGGVEEAQIDDGDL